MRNRPCRILGSIHLKLEPISFSYDSSLQLLLHGHASESWTRLLDVGYGVEVIYLDYRKASDFVSYKGLLTKLKFYGIPGKLYS